MLAEFPSASGTSFYKSNNVRFCQVPAAQVRTATAHLLVHLLRFITDEADYSNQVCMNNANLRREPP